MFPGSRLAERVCVCCPVKKEVIGVFGVKVKDYGEAWGVLYELRPARFAGVLDYAVRIQKYR